MRADTLDLYMLSRCPRRFLRGDRVRRGTSPTQKAMKRVVLSRALGRHSRWTLKGLASIWDSLFWEEREIEQSTINASVRGVVSLRKLYKLLPTTYESYSCQDLTVSIDGLELSSAGDFLLISNNVAELWIYARLTPTEVRRSILPAAERFILEKKIRAEKLPKEVELVIYCPTTQGMNPLFFRVRCPPNEKGVLATADLLRKQVNIPIGSDWCASCPTKC